MGGAAQGPEEARRGEPEAVRHGRPQRHARRHPGVFLEDFRKVYDGVSTVGGGRLGEFVGKWPRTCPGLFTYLSFPKPMRKSIYTPNVIEAFNGKAKRELAKMVSMNSLGNVQFCMTQIAREYNRHVRRIRGWDEMTEAEFEEVGMRR